MAQGVYRGPGGQGQGEGQGQGHVLELLYYVYSRGPPPSLKILRLSVLHL